MPKLFYFSTVRRVFAFVVLLPPPTADVACPRFVDTDETWRFRTMSRFSIVLFSPRPMRLVTKWMLPALSLFVFPRHDVPFLVVVGFSLSVGVLPFCYGCLPCFLAYFFPVESPRLVPRWRPCADSPAHLSALFGLYFVWSYRP